MAVPLGTLKDAGNGGKTDRFWSLCAQRPNLKYGLAQIRRIGP